MRGSQYERKVYAFKATPRLSPRDCQLRKRGIELMNFIRTALLALCLTALGSLTVLAQGGASTAYGDWSLKSNSGFWNAAFGVMSLYSNTSGSQNSAFGFGALAANTTNSNQSAFGFQALSSNTTGRDNSAFGANTLGLNTAGYENSAFGYGSLYVNTEGNYNTAMGNFTLNANTSGNLNTALGYASLYFNTTGLDNIGLGPWALFDNQNGNDNLAVGISSLYSNKVGSYNTAFGESALGSNEAGSYNIGLGYYAGFNNPSAASNNIDIGNMGSSSDVGIVRIGTAGKQQFFFVSGVFGVASQLGNATNVMIDSNGQLCVKNSSIRFKEDVHDMAGASSGIFRLRPVTYRYKQAYADGSKPIDYGLIAEEVEQVYPDLVSRNSDGQIQTVQYDKLVPMLLNEVQKQQSTIEKLENRLSALEAVAPAASATSTLPAE